MLANVVLRISYENSNEFYYVVALLATTLFEGTVFDDAQRNTAGYVEVSRCHRGCAQPTATLSWFVFMQNGKEMSAIEETLIIVRLNVLGKLLSTSPAATTFHRC